MSGDFQFKDITVQLVYLKCASHHHQLNLNPKLSIFKTVPWREMQDDEWWLSFCLLLFSFGLEISLSWTLWLCLRNWWVSSPNSSKASLKEDQKTCGLYIYIIKTPWLHLHAWVRSLREGKAEKAAHRGGQHDLCPFHVPVFIHIPGKYKHRTKQNTKWPVTQWLL